VVDVAGSERRLPGAAHQDVLTNAKHQFPS
jgi:hypothetical protein